MTRVILRCLLAGAGITVLVGVASTVLYRPAGPHGFDEEIARNLGGPNEPATGSLYFSRAHSAYLTEVEAVVATYDKEDSRSRRVSVDKLPAWCLAASEPWTSGIRPWPQPDSGDWRVWVTAGWPMRCVGYEFGPASSFPRTAWNSTPIGVHGGIELRRQSQFIVAIPLRPRWAGFATDSAVYAITWLALVRGPRAIVRFLRRGRGHCPSCAYDRRGLPPDASCPECGATGAAL